MGFTFYPETLFNGRLLQSIYPWIDPLDAFYLLNPSGDLKDLQAIFKQAWKSGSDI